MKCDCELSDLFEAAKQTKNPIAISRFSETSGYIWCDKHRVYVGFTAPKEAWSKPRALPTTPVQGEPQ